MDYIIGIDIGGTKCAVVAAKANVAPEENFIIRKIKFPTNPLNPAESLQDIDNAIDQILSELPLENGNSLVGIGISCGSPEEIRMCWHRQEIRFEQAPSF